MTNWQGCCRQDGFNPLCLLLCSRELLCKALDHITEKAQPEIMFLHQQCGHRSTQEERGDLSHSQGEVGHCVQLLQHLCVHPRAAL